MQADPQLCIPQLRAAVSRRKATRASLENTPLVDPRLFSKIALTGDVLLQGTLGSPGVAEGPVRVVHDPSEFDKLAPGDVLVAPYTNLAWTPLFLRAAAVVVDTGSLGSHAAIVAREYAIPAVIGDHNRYADTPGWRMGSCGREPECGLTSKSTSTLVALAFTATT